MFNSTARQRRLRSVGFAASLAVIGLAAAAQASATCMDVKNVLPKMSGTASTVHLVPAVYRPDSLSRGSLLPVGDFADEDSSIVGLWQFKFAGFLLDWGTEAFHADGTEILFSGGQNPETGDVCQGVWRRVGHNTYTLNHIAMGWVAPGAGFGIRVHIHAVIRVSSTGNAFTGNYSAKVFSVGPTDPFDESVEVASGTGSMSGTRVRPD